MRLFQKIFNHDKLDLFNEAINAAIEKSEGILTLREPKVYAMNEESNLASKYSDKYIATQDGNLCAAFKIEGISYSAITLEGEIELVNTRNRFWSKLDSNVEINIFCRKEKIHFELDSTSQNLYAQEIIQQWESGIVTYQINYYLIVSTKSKKITGYFEAKREKMTTEQIANNIDSENNTTRFEFKAKKLDEVCEDIKSGLENFKPIQLDADSIINFYATYSNMQTTNLRYGYENITDSYITSDVAFKKDFIVFTRNDGKEIFGRFLSVKAYETENLSSILPTTILRENSDYFLIFHMEALDKNTSIEKVKNAKLYAVDIIQNALEMLSQEIKSDREKLLRFSLSVLVLSESGLEDLNTKTNSILAILKAQNLSVARESFNLKALFFSFFPSRGNLNARIRTQTSSVISTLCTFENDILGFKSNRWGNRPVTILRHLSGSPYFFNFHDSPNKNAVGHTLVVGGTGYGKTTLMQFFMMNLFKYDINIFAMDKLRGMHNFTNYMGAEYHDLELDGFKLNPFSLADTDENNNFLKTWLCEMGEIGKGEHELRHIVGETIRQIRETQRADFNHIFTLKDFYDSLQFPNSQDDLKIRFKDYLGGLFDNTQDALNFEKQLSVLNMDSILKDKKRSALCALYLFHKIKNISKNSHKGFFIWIDELRDYLNDENMCNAIIEAIMEIRKINGVITMGVQNLDFFKNVSNAEAFIENMANIIIFPTSDIRTLERLQDQLSLTNSEINFLQNTTKASRRVLLKRKEESAILDVNLSRIGEYLRIFSSEVEDVNALIESKKLYPQEWRSVYLDKQQSTHFIQKEN
ncbi:AAA family ATPase [Helicobacter sp. MIT 05-5293]|uniref:VirB4 family type IV secretion/conjugal transfer ATPase n=1 Tax=Helicobacter sp. MIT 05-5293 TaxID=1548149 RepID=UPI00068CC3F1|nr:hypothetical protein [Helicobacter sp. MIT 05-5293]TLD79948.1 AAA family ATPase [Helicobacter sp. MIT 05-5293]